MSCLHPNQDLKDDTEKLRHLIEVPATARRLYPRGGFEGLEPNHLQILIALRLAAGMTVNELVETLTLGQGTVSTGLSILEDRGLVKAKSDPDDRRRRRQQLTAAGEQTVARFVAGAPVPD
jgi:DNA-binding MarR family transcriptional regulator